MQSKIRIYRNQIFIFVLPLLLLLLLLFYYYYYYCFYHYYYYYYYYYYYIPLPVYLPAKMIALRDDQITNAARLWCGRRHAWEQRSQSNVIFWSGVV